MESIDSGSKLTPHQRRILSLSPILSFSLSRCLIVVATLEAQPRRCHGCQRKATDMRHCTGALMHKRERERHDIRMQRYASEEEPRQRQANASLRIVVASRTHQHNGRMKLRKLKMENKPPLARRRQRGPGN